MRTLLYRASAQISMVSARGTLVKRLETSKKQRKIEEGERPELRRVSTVVYSEPYVAAGLLLGR